MALPFVSPPSRSPLAFINLVADAVVSLTNKLVTASGLSAWIAARSTALTAPGTGDGQRLVREADCSPAATAANPVLTHSACTSAPSNADGDRLVNQADCTTAATAANPPLSVGGLTARATSTPGTGAGTLLITQAAVAGGCHTAASATNDVLTEADRPILYRMTWSEIGQNPTPAAAPNWTAALGTIYLRRPFNPSWVGGKAKISTTCLGAAAINKVAHTAQHACRIANAAGGEVLAEGQETGQTTGYQSIPLTTATPANLTDGTTSQLITYVQTVAGTAGGATNMNDVDLLLLGA